MIAISASARCNNSVTPYATIIHRLCIDDPRCWSAGGADCENKEILDSLDKCIVGMSGHVVRGDQVFGGTRGPQIDCGSALVVA